MSELRRRSVIAGTAAAAATTTATVTASPAHAAKASTDLLSRSRFSPQVGSTFTMTSSTGSSTSVVLTAVGDLGPGSTPGSDRQFAVSFAGSTGSKARPDGVYSFSRKGFTATSLFVVAATDGTHWRATVNRV